LQAALKIDVLFLRELSLQSFAQEKAGFAHKKVPVSPAFFRARKTAGGWIPTTSSIYSKRYSRKSSSRFDHGEVEVFVTIY
jgi:hypothetical protein